MTICVSETYFCFNYGWKLQICANEKFLQTNFLFTNLSATHSPVLDDIMAVSCNDTDNDNHIDILWKHKAGIAFGYGKKYTI